MFRVLDLICLMYIAEPGIPIVKAGRIAEYEKRPSHPEAGTQFRYTAKNKISNGAVRKIGIA